MTYEKKLENLKNRLEELQVKFEHRENLSLEKRLELRGRILELIKTITLLESD